MIGLKEIRDSMNEFERETGHEARVEQIQTDDCYMYTDRYVYWLIEKIVKLSPSPFQKEDLNVKYLSGPCFDANGEVLNDGDRVDVQNAGVHKIYKKENGVLYFRPYGEEEPVGLYFQDDLIKVD